MIFKEILSADGFDGALWCILIQANRWGQGNSVNVMFNLASAVEDDGVYTLFAMVKEGEEIFDVTSYSIFVDSEDTAQ